MKRPVVILVAVLFVALGFWISSGSIENDISPDVLAERVMSCTPAWANYNEDLKGKIGSTPVARWKGQPIRAFIEGHTATIVFKLEGYWTTTEVQLPVLVREPLGDVLEAVASRRNGVEVSYTFPLKPEVVSEGGGTWLEIQYPHRTQRIVFDSTGSWSK